MENYLQYGALGLLAIVLIALGAFAREYIKVSGKHREENDKFFRATVDRANSRHDVHMSAWQEMAALAVKAQSATGDAVKDVLRELEDHERASDDRHDKVIQAIKD